MCHSLPSLFDMKKQCDAMLASADSHVGFSPFYLACRVDRSRIRLPCTFDITWLILTRLRYVSIVCATHS